MTLKEPPPSETKIKETMSVPTLPKRDTAHNFNVGIPFDEPFQVQPNTANNFYGSDIFAKTSIENSSHFQKGSGRKKRASSAGGINFIEK